MHKGNVCTYPGDYKIHSSHYNKGGKRGGICFSLLLIGIGALFLFEYLGWLGDYEVIQFWPIALMFPGVSGLFRARYWAGRMFALVVLVFANLALVNNLGLFTVPWGLIWPLAIVTLGASIMAMVALYPKRKSSIEVPKDFMDSSDILNTRIVCGGKEEDLGTSVFKGGVVDIFMGGYELDLRATSMETEGIDLYLRVKLAGVKIRVPQEWNVKIEGATFMGVIENNSGCVATDVEKTLRIHATVRQGAVEIGN